jgi:uncharacterized membrane protein
MPVIILAGLFGSFFFAVADGSGMDGLLFGALVGCAIQLSRLKGRISQLEARVSALPTPAVEPAASKVAGPLPASRPPEDRAAPVVVVQSDPVADAAGSPGLPMPDQVADTPRGLAPLRDAAPKPVFKPAPRDPGPLDHAVAAAVRYFTTGNVVARVGSVVLFFGVAFLLKYAADRNIVPIQLRLGGVAATGLALLGIGWRLRSRGVYGQILQGTGVGTLYLTTYVAMKVYALVPAAWAFPILVAAVVVSGWLSLMQDSRPLATMGTLGGFLAPILTSTGEGSHVVLFSYYALLNLGIFGVAWARAWRELNLLGFAFTFVVASLWGYRAYTPAHYATTQPFLAFQWGLYIAISILFATRRKKDGMGFVDGTLVFGVPTAGFALQAAIAADFDDGITCSALAASAAYLLVGRGLAMRGGASLTRLRQAFLGLSAAFATLAIPLALEDHALASAWALEGLALLWIGVRQDSRLQRATGLVLQVGAAVSMTISGGGSYPVPVLNGQFVAAVLVAVAGMASAYLLTARYQVKGSNSHPVSALVLAWGLFWWLGGGINELQAFAPEATLIPFQVLFFALTAVALDRVSRMLRWAMVGLPAIGLMPVLAVMLVTAMALPDRSIVLSAWGAAAWTAAFAAHLALLRWRAEHWDARVVRIWHAAGMLLVAGLITRDSGWAAEHLARLSLPWTALAYVATPTLLLYLLPLTRRLGWPLGRFQSEYSGLGLAPVALALGVFATGITLRMDPSAPLPYLPLLHPYEIAQAVILAGLLRWWTMSRTEPLLRELPAATGAICVGMLAFLAINGVLARAVHSYAGTPFTVDALFGSRTFHAGLSILWSTLAMGIMVYASRRLVAPLWFGGAALLGAVVLKLFFVELGGSGTVARIVSFLAVGLLMLLIGYLAPMPPREEEPAPVLGG